MANKRFPADMADITADFVSVLAVKADGTVGYAFCLAKTGGTVTGNLNIAGGTLYISNSGTESSYQLNATTIGYDNTNSIGWITAGGAASRTNISLQAGGGNVLIGTSVSNGVDKLQVSGSGNFSGTVTSQGNVLTSAREKKHVFGKFEDDALTQINSLKLHKFSYKKFKTTVLEPEKVDKKGKILKPAIHEEIELPATEPEHIGVMYDEVQDNPNIATSDGAIKLHNLVFLLVKANQELSAQVGDLTKRVEKLEKAKK